MKLNVQCCSSITNFLMLSNIIRKRNKIFIDTFNYQNANFLAFSLIELSIVLIIVGLLVSGITGGASLIESAKKRAFINELNQWDVITNTFYVLKDRLPSDVNNDGRFGQFSGDIYTNYFPAPYDGSKYAVPDEFMAPFVDLYLNKIIEFEPRYSATDQNKNLPTSNSLKNDSVYYFVDLSGHPVSDYYVRDLNGNIILLSFVSSKSKYKMSFARDIDNKVDNNDPNSGKLRVSAINKNNEAFAGNSYNNVIDNNEYLIKFIAYDLIK